MINQVETERLLIRRFKEDDAADLYAYAKMPEVGPEAGWLPHKNIDESKEIVARWISDPEIFAICDKQSGHVIGSLGLHQRFDRAVPCREMGYALSKDYWGRGLMSEAVKVMRDYAFNEFGIEILTISHHHLNTRSCRVIEKAGFVYEGVTRKARKHPLTGVVLDVKHYSMTKDEWRHLQ